MMRGRGCFGSCYLNEFIYVIGGVNIEQGVLSFSEKYDIHRDQWYDLAPLHLERKNASVCPLAIDSLYVFGGTC
jgi:hypothetical protein